MTLDCKVLPRFAEDSRLVADRHTYTNFPITTFASRQAVTARREELRFSLRMAAGLYPWPERTPLNTRIEDVQTCEGYSVKKIMFESRPGFWSTGNLYLPEPCPEKAPAILNVIGHWEPQRLTRKDTADYPQQLANFARMGFICLVTDMIGKVDSLQITHEYGKDEKELWTSNGLGVQLWNNIRALDLLCSMPEVDENNIGVTGASGGGSQSLFLALADDRIKACAPINMISLHFQGGCQCENAAGLRRLTNNGEMCAVLAPRALFLAGSTGDWTKNQETAEVPQMLEAYRHFDAEHMVEHYYQVADHQYNHKTRRRIYSFFARHLMGRELIWEEQPIEVDDLDALTWFRGKGHAPGFDGDEAFFAAHKQERLAAAASLPVQEKQRMLSWITGIDGSSFAIADPNTEVIDGVTVEKNIINASRGEQIPFVRLIPAGWDGKKACLVLSEKGKSCVNDPEVQKLLQEGTAIVSGDLFMTGEYVGAQQKIEGGERGEKYFTTFHYTTDAFRAQDVARLWEVTRNTAPEACVRADGCAARALVCALPLLRDVKQASLEAAALELTTDEQMYRDCFVPGIMVLGGLSGCLALADCPVKTF